MAQYSKSVIPVIESVYESLTNVEKNIANFFLNSPEKANLSAKAVSERLFVSEASLSRFAKKCGFSGYREFIFRYQESLGMAQKSMNDGIDMILNTYQEILSKSYDLVDEQKMERIAKLFTRRKRVYVYGKGSSGLVANEMKLRFMRVGVDIEAITDSHIMKINSVMVDENCLVIGITVSGKTQEVLSAVEDAGKRGAATVLVTARMQQILRDIYDEVVLIPIKENLKYGNVISPQFPALILVDMMYVSYLRYDKANKEVFYDYTLHRLRGGAFPES